LSEKRAASQTRDRRRCSPVDETIFSPGKIILTDANNNPDAALIRRTSITQDLKILSVVFRLRP
jgi:hypothetical protein